MTAVIKHDKIPIEQHLNDAYVIGNLNTSQRNVMASIAYNVGFYSELSVAIRKLEVEL